MKRRTYIFSAVLGVSLLAGYCVQASADESDSVLISLNGSSADCDSDAVSIEESIVTIKDEGTYVISGSLENGMIIVDADDKDEIQLILDNASINSDTSAAVYVAKADKVVVTLADDSQNSLSNGGEFESIDDNNIDAVVFSKDELTFNGEGTLTITSPAGHGIVSKDELSVTQGEYNIMAEKQGISAKESINIENGTFNIEAGKDGIHAENNDDADKGSVYITDGVYNITADGDGISASNDMQIEDGSFTIITGGGSETVTLDSEGNWGWDRKGGGPGMEQSKNNAEDTVSAKGIKAGGDLLINGGDFSIDAADDALHSNADLTVNGGSFNIASGDDGIHADETAAVTDGTITITKSYEGIEGNNVNIEGGIIDLTASDDGMNAAGGNDESGNGGFGGFQRGGFDEATDSTITISGGTIHINASGDGVDSNGDLIVTGGETYVSGPTNSGNGALDYSGEAKITGGIFVASGSQGMAQNFGTESKQGAMLVNISGSENDTIILKDSNGEELGSWTVDKEFSCVVISCPEIIQGETYTVTVGESSTEVEMESLIYGSGGMGGFGDMGGNRGDRTGMKGEVAVNSNEGTKEK